MSMNTSGKLPCGQRDRRCGASDEVWDGSSTRPGRDGVKTIHLGKSKASGAFVQDSKAAGAIQKASLKGALGNGRGHCSYSLSDRTTGTEDPKGLSSSVRVTTEQIPKSVVQ